MKALSWPGKGCAAAFPIRKSRQDVSGQKDDCIEIVLKP
jgi:hypothetical protein